MRVCTEDWLMSDYLDLACRVNLYFPQPQAWLFHPQLCPQKFVLLILLSIHESWPRAVCQVQHSANILATYEALHALWI